MRITLNHGWKITYDDGTCDNISLPHEFPMTEQSYPNPVCFSGLYERKLTELKGISNKRIMLRFHGIDWLSKIYVNGKQVLHHENGYDLFEVEITDFLNFDGHDILKIHVSDFDISDKPEIVVGKQDWYGNACGIIQNIELWAVDDVFIKSAKFIPVKDLKTIKCEIEFSDRQEHDFSLTVIDPSGTQILNEKFSRSTFDLLIDDPKLWSLKSPQLYTAIIDFAKDSSKDRFQTTFGIRSIDVDEDRILLNGEPVYIFGALDQNFYPVNHYTLPEKNDLLSELLKAKEMGLNLLRFHVKIPDDLYLEIADELGLLIWIDLPYARQLNEKSMGYLEKLLENLLKRHANHPSFVLLSLINESWGVDLSEEQTRSWLKMFFRKAKVLDDTRLYVDNSACMGNFHVISDIDDFHFYHSFPYHNAQWDEKIKSFATGDFKSFFESSTESKKLPKIVSEFGVWGLSDPKDWEGNWMKFPVTTMGMKFSNSSPIEAIARVCGFHNIDDFIYQTQLNQFLGLKYQIEKIRLRPEISGYVITEFSDIAWEANGLLDYNRMPKIFHSKLRFLNKKILPIIKNHTAIIQDGDTYHAQIYIANNSGKNMDADLIIRTDTKILKQIPVPLKKWSVSEGIDFSAKFEHDTQNIFLEVFENGNLISRNFYPVVVLGPAPLSDEILWVNDDLLQDEELVSISEKRKLHGFLDLSGDWISNLTIFNTKRNKNISALLWSLGEVASEYVLISKQTDKMLSSDNSLISKITGWGYAFTSILYIKEKEGKRKVYTTLKNNPLSRSIISYVLY
ncbi:sugar-binding domain-containing protein [Pseudothermotoga sp.]|uniref:glycoside hydrolase family 2 protein n=1 Tax=Pseudothermotoga sp. TaxID=2033661 RepID=UPI000E92646B|nr:sugar-binding domain-containing protein [Pseudothermotoga sp.]HBJ81086.1 glycoside hydrolase family 2 [Pseudothermotoga sp.]